MIFQICFPDEHKPYLAFKMIPNLQETQVHYNHPDRKEAQVFHSSATTSRHTSTTLSHRLCHQTDSANRKISRLQLVLGSKHISKKFTLLDRECESVWSIISSGFKNRQKTHLRLKKHGCMASAPCRLQFHTANEGLSWPAAVLFLTSTFPQPKENPVTGRSS